MTAENVVEITLLSTDSLKKFLTPSQKEAGLNVLKKQSACVFLNVLIVWILIPTSNELFIERWTGAAFKSELSHDNDISSFLNISF